MNNGVPLEPFDALGYLVPPVKKDYSASNKHLKSADHLLRDLRRNIFLNSSPCSSTELDVHTCSSLLLEKSTKRFIQEQFSIFNVTKYNSIYNLYCKNKKQHKNSHLNEKRPIIKVTVIPKVEENNTGIIFNKRCKKSRKIHTTVSNHEKFIKNPNCYCLIKGTKREKVPKLKNSESYNLSNRDVNERYGNIPFRKISESKQFLDSFNMDKKKRRERKVKNKKTVLISENNCNCAKDVIEDTFCNVDGRRSRVTIVGQLGLNNEDRYVLKCAATVNDKPIATNVISDFHDDFPSFNRSYNFNKSRYQNSNIGCYADNCEGLRTYRQQDSNVQTDFVYPYSSNAATTERNRVASQGTQVNFNFSNQVSSKNFMNQTAQCTRSIIATTLETEGGDNVLKECKSPLVIISVYPRPDNANDNETVKIIRHTSPGKKEITNSMRNNIKQEKFREPSPVRTIKTKLTTMESKLNRSRSSSPKTKKEFINKSETGGKNYNSFKKGSSRQVRSPKSNAINNLQKVSACQCNTKSLETEGLDQKEINTMLSKSRNTEQVKKALVNSFLRNMQDMDRNNKNNKQLPPKDDASKVTINIDGEKEHYNVWLENSNYDSAVYVKKTMKASQKHTIEEDLTSLKNVLMYADDDVNNEYSHNIRRSQQSYDTTKIKPDSRLNVRDSIEIFRRQGKHSNHTFKPVSKNDKNNNSTEKSFNTDFSATIKHYPGDNCSISDPNERDREIRELLGVIRNQRKQMTETNKDACLCNDEGCCCINSSNGMMTESSNNQINKHYKHKNRKEEQTEIIYTEASNLKYEKKDNHALSQKHQSESKVSEESENVTKTDHDHISETLDINVSLQSEFPPKIIEETLKKDVTIKDDAPAIINFRLVNDKNALKRVSIVDTNIPQQKDNILSRNLIVNRNIQIYLQVQHLHREKPVLLNKKQYEKVKKNIERKISKKFSIDKRKPSSLKKCNIVSVGEIKVKPKVVLPLHIDHEAQTDRIEIKTQENCKLHKNRKENTLHVKKDVSAYEKKDRIKEDCAVQVVKDNNICQKSPRQAVSSVEIRYEKMKYKKYIKISSSSTRFSNCGMQALHAKSVKRDDSILTLFKGHKKTATPNLGTSSFSLYSDRSDVTYNSLKQPQCAGDFKPKKPLLQRLISCIVMRSNDLSNKKDVLRKQTVQTLNSTDSYHLSTSLGVLEMSSSLYDTSTSFYSNHTILPVNKIKKGFFSWSKKYRSQVKSYGTFPV